MSDDINIYKLVRVLTGEIQPVGDSHIDNNRLENLKKLIELTETLIQRINDVAYWAKNSELHSKKRAGELAEKFLKDIYKE